MSSVFLTVNSWTDACLNSVECLTHKPESTIVRPSCICSQNQQVHGKHLASFKRHSIFFLSVVINMVFAGEFLGIRGLKQLLWLTATVETRE